VTVAIVAAFVRVGANRPRLAALFVRAEAADIAFLAIFAVNAAITVLVAVLAIGTTFIVVRTFLLIQTAIFALHAALTFRAALRVVLAGAVRLAAGGVPIDAFLARLAADGFAHA
jgi:hypothetical protein